MGKSVERYQDQQRHISSPSFTELLLGANHLGRSSDFNPDFKSSLRLVDDAEAEKFLQRLGTKLIAFKVYYERHKREIGKDMGVPDRLLGGEILNMSIGRVQQQLEHPERPITVQIYLRSWGKMMVTKTFNLSEEIEIDHEDLSREFIDALDLQDRQANKAASKPARASQ